MLCRLSEKELGLLKTLMQWVQVLDETPNPDHVTAWLKRQQTHWGVDIKAFNRKLDRMPESWLATVFGWRK